MRQLLQPSLRKKFPLQKNKQKSPRRKKLNSRKSADVKLGSKNKATLEREAIEAQQKEKKEEEKIEEKEETKKTESIPVPIEDDMELPPLNLKDGN